MSDIDYYFGAYLEITCNKITVERTFRDCTNGHGPIKDKSNYCSECGAEINWVTGMVDIYPNWFSEIFGKDIDTMLVESTPRSLFGKGVIIAMDERMGEQYKFWLSNSKSDIIEIPTEVEIFTKMNNFNKEYTKIIHTLKELAIVKSVVTKFGIIKKEW